MTKRSLSSLALVLVAGGACAVAGLTALTPAPATAAAPVIAPAAADAYSVDPVHASVVYRVKHLNTSYFYGRFNAISGSFNLNFEKPDASSLEISVKTDSVDSGNAKRDEHLKSEDFFSAKEYPTISFKGKTFKKTSDTAFEVGGDLTLHGETKPLTITVEQTGAGKGMAGEAIAGIETRFTVKRSDFGFSKKMIGPVGDEVTLYVAFEGAKK